MNNDNRYIIVRAVSLPTDDEVRSWQPPPGFPLIIDTTTMALCEPAVSFLLDHRVDPQYPHRFSDAVPGEAHDIKDFLEYLDFQNLNLSDIEALHLKKYRDILYAARSPKTYGKYSKATIKRRLATIVSFCNYLVRKGIIRRQNQIFTTRKLVPNAESQSGKHNAASTEVSFKTKNLEQSRIHVISNDHLRRIFDALGPIPDLKCQDRDHPLTRNRLISEIALHVGMRRLEITHLTTKQIAQLAAASEGKLPRQAVYLNLNRTKGQHPGKARFPVWLVQLLIWYIKYERPTSTSHPKWTDHGLLFVNNAGQRGAGNPITNDTISTMFHEAVIKSGLSSSSIRKRPGAPSQTNRADVRKFTESLYVFHDLRHTFASRIYNTLCQIQKSKGTEIEPWKIVQRLLRHKHLSTTIDIYLNAFEGSELSEEIDDAIGVWVNEVIDDDT